MMDNWCSCVALAAVAACQPHPARAPEVTLLNVSFDATRELYVELNAAFTRRWQARTGRAVRVDQSHSGSAKQAHSVIDGLEADVVSLALATDVDAIAEHGGLLSADWRRRLPHHSVPFSSTVVFLVRRGNPKHIRDWDDLARSDVEAIPGNPKTSGGARWAYLAAWGYGLEQGGVTRARELVTRLYRNAPVLDSGARAATTTFAERELGDVLINWESDALFTRQELADRVELVYPSVSVVAETPVALIEANAAKHGTTEVAQGYLEYLFSDEAQEIAVRHGFRPASDAIARRHAATLPALRSFTVDEKLGGWREAERTHFAEGGVFDQIYVGAR
jgi:sulfate transport system substrate-binding protein